MTNKVRDFNKCVESIETYLFTCKWIRSVQSHTWSNYENGHHNKTMMDAFVIQSYYDSDYTEKIMRALSDRGYKPTSAPYFSTFHGDKITVEAKGKKQIDEVCKIFGISNG
jgi:hypothetical protein